MSNSSSSSANTHLVSTIADSLLEWIQNDIFPVCVATFDSLAIVCGLVLNILLLVTFTKRGLHNEPSTHFVFNLIIVDFIAYALVLLFNIITAGLSDWKLTQPVCEIHGAMFDVLMFANFSFVTILCVERGFKLCKPDLYDRTFANKKFVIVMTVIVWVFITLVGFVPVTGAGDIIYEFYHQGCMLDYTQQHIFLIVHFLLAIFIPTVCVIASYALIFEHRRKAITENRAELFKKVKNDDKAKLTSNPSASSTGESALAPIAENEEDDNVFDERVNKPSSPSKPLQQGFDRRRSSNKVRPKSSPRRQSLLFEVFSDDEENPAFHLSITYIALWGTMVACYLPYFIVFFIGTYSGPLWGGFYTITLMVAHVSFVVKPIVYLGHNRHYRLVTKETVPDAVKQRARSMRSSIGSIGSTMEDFVFRSNANKQFRAALATQKAVLVWKRKMNKSKNVFKLKDKTDTNTDVTALVANEKTGAVTPVSYQPNPSAAQTNADSMANMKIPNLNAPEMHTSDAGRSLPATPSGIAITASSFIERERQKMFHQNQPGSLGDGHEPDQAISPTGQQKNGTVDNSVPGMVSYDTLFDRQNPPADTSQNIANV